MNVNTDWTWNNKLNLIDRTYNHTRLPQLQDQAQKGNDDMFSLLETVSAALERVARSKEVVYLTNTEGKVRDLECSTKNGRVDASIVLQTG